MIKLFGSLLQLFVANKNRPAEIASVLANNKDKLLRLLEGLKTDKGGVTLNYFVCVYEKC